MIYQKSLQQLLAEIYKAKGTEQAIKNVFLNVLILDRQAFKVGELILNKVLRNNLEQHLVKELQTLLKTTIMML